jgi:hypothetical protein
MIDFKSQYKRKTYVDFFKDRLLPDDFLPAEEEVHLHFKSKYFSKVTFLGKCPSLELNVYEIRHQSANDARVSLSRDSFKLVSNYTENNALILFVPENNSNYRLSWVSIIPKLDTKGVKIKREYTNPRRYSFVLGADTKTHTPEQYLIKSGRINNFDDLKNRFSVEVVNKDFYSQIANLFSQLVGGKRSKGKSTIEYQQQLKLPEIHNDNRQKHKEFAVRLIGRTVFCWFLKNKKSSAGIPLINNDVLSSEAVNSTKDFYHERVEPLFFEILSTPIENRNKIYRTELFNSIPYLNGGLFEPHSDDFYANHKPNYYLIIPNSWWFNFLELLETYNFTIDENTSMDIDLSVDPEMLGRIFENLLAEINEQTGDSDRIRTGSFYTPRPIVEYMVDQSLKQYLIQQTGIDENKLDSLLDYVKESSELDDAEEKKIVKALSTVKVLDPACGSGAFPMGILQKMLLILQKVDREATNSLSQILDGIKDPMKRELLRKKLESAKIIDDKNLNDYARKLNVIQSSIYGIDIQAIATDISRLRFFLSLVVDEVIQDEMPNRGIEPLPNLDFKFVTANSLVSLPEMDSFEKMYEKEDLIKELHELRLKYFTASNEDKPKLRNKFKALQSTLFEFVNKNLGSINKNKSLMYSITAWEPFSDESTPWFDPEWMFGIKDGFDIVIGNPPYVQLQKEGGRLAKQFEKMNYQTFTKTGDIYALFYEKGINLLNSGGLLTFITSNKWMRAGYGEKLREFFSQKDPIILIDLGPGAFESATVDTNILLIKNNNNSNNLRAVTISSNSDDNIDIISILKNDGVIINKLTKDAWTISGDLEMKIKDKIEGIGTPLKDWDISINYGIKTGFNDAFIIDGKTKDELIAADPKSAEILKPILRGRDIKRYKAEFADKWLIFTAPALKINIDNYPAIRDYLKSFGERIHQTGENGCRKKTYNKWFELQDTIAFYEDFEKEKIVWKRIGSVLRFQYDNSGSLCLDSTCFLSSNRKDIKYLCALMNSKISYKYLLDNSPKTGTGDVITSVQAIEPLFIPQISPKAQQPFIDLVDKILAKKAKGEDSTPEEREIDQLVYKLYDLTAEEIAIVEGKDGTK